MMHSIRLIDNLLVVFFCVQKCGACAVKAIFKSTNGIFCFCRVSTEENGRLYFSPKLSLCVEILAVCWSF